MLKKIIIAALLLSTVLNASSNEVNKLVGTYSANYYGKQNDRYRIEKHDHNFWILKTKEIQNGKEFMKKEKLIVLIKSDLKKSLKQV